MSSESTRKIYKPLEIFALQGAELDAAVVTSISGKELARGAEGLKALISGQAVPIPALSSNRDAAHEIEHVVMKEFGDDLYLACLREACGGKDAKPIHIVRANATRRLHACLLTVFWGTREKS